MYCTKCGTQINKDALFCKSCGERVPKLLEWNDESSPALEPSSPSSKIEGGLMITSAIFFFAASVTSAVSVNPPNHTLNVFHLGNSFGYTKYAGGLMMLLLQSVAIGYVAYTNKKPTKWLRWARIFLLILGLLNLTLFIHYLQGFVSSWNSVSGAPRQSIGPAVAVWTIGLMLYAVGALRLSTREFRINTVEFYLPVRRSLFINTGEAWFRRFFDFPIYSDWMLYYYIFGCLGVGLDIATSASWAQTSAPGTNAGAAVASEFLGTLIFIGLPLYVFFSLLRSVFRKIRARS